MLNQWIREHRRHVRHMVVSTFLVAFALAAILFPSSSAAAADLTQEDSQSAAAEPAQEVFLVARTSLPEKSTAEEVQLKEGQRVVIRWNDEEHSILAKDETVYLNNPVEGEARSVKGTVDITTDYGEELSREVLAQQSPKGGTGMVVTTGTEYSQYLERVHGLDVLTDTYSEVANNARNDLQRIIDKQSR